jgi:cytochrome P450
MERAKLQDIASRLNTGDELITSTSCPFDYGAKAHQKTTHDAEPVDVPVECDEHGVWHIRGFEEARAILRSGNTRQAGFKAEVIRRTPQAMRRPILYQEGKEHNQQRKQTARFFTPKAVSENYRQLMETLADQLIADLQRKKRINLCKTSMALAVRVAAEVVGLTNSLLPGMSARLDAFFAQDFSFGKMTLRRFLRTLVIQRRIAAFFFLDVKPAIQARRRKLREDVISHLIGQGYRDSEILTECITYASAGMATTREFVSIAAWHFLEQPTLRARYLVAPEEERHAMLQEILRLEPVIGNIYRRATADIHLTSNGVEFVIPQDALVNVHVYGANADETVVGEEPLTLCPGRKLRDERIPTALMSFGDGQHRCPGAYIAIQETDIFLQRLLALESLHIEIPPTLSWNDLIAGYELRDFIIAL